MKRKVLIISIICVLLVITFIVICSSFNKDSIDKTKSIIVTNLKSDNISKKEITDKDKIKEVISIIKERKELEKDTEKNAYMYKILISGNARRKGNRTSETDT